MKRLSRMFGVFACAVMLLTVMTVGAFAADNEIDISKANEGCVTVSYSDGTCARMKVGITFNGKTTYQDYTQGTVSSYALLDGDGTYTITLFRNVSGTSYRKVARSVVTVDLSSELAPYLVSTTKVNFAAGDEVSRLAEELCRDKATDAEKVVAIHNYIAANFVYDSQLAAQIDSGAVTAYVPQANAVLAAKKGICYDLASLFAAMCRSQEIPCKLTVGYADGVYHAWNQVYVDGVWQTIDPTYAIARVTAGAADLQGCISPRTMIETASM